MKQVIVVRRDLKMRRGKEAAQVAHASVKSALSYSMEQINPDPKVQVWLHDGMTKIVVHCENEEELMELARKASDKRIPCSFIRDAGNTEVAPNTLTCIAFGPDEDHKIDAVTGHLKLL